MILKTKMYCETRLDNVSSLDLGDLTGFVAPVFKEFTAVNLAPKMVAKLSRLTSTRSVPVLTPN